MPASNTGGRISFQLRPAKKITASPEAITSREVPRSGCFMIRPTGSSSRTPATRKSSGRSWPSRRWNHQASIRGVAILRISLGWMTTPRLIQRLAPFLVMPNSATAISRATPTVYSGTANSIRRWGGTWATTNMMPPAISMLRAWSTKRVPWSNPAEYMVTSPAQTSRKTAKASQPSKPCTRGRRRWDQGGFSKTADIKTDYPARRQPPRGIFSNRAVQAPPLQAGNQGLGGIRSTWPG